MDRNFPIPSNCDTDFWDALKSNTLDLNRCSNNDSSTVHSIQRPITGLQRPDKHLLHEDMSRRGYTINHMLSRSILEPDLSRQHCANHTVSFSLTAPSASWRGPQRLHNNTTDSTGVIRSSAANRDNRVYNTTPSTSRSVNNGPEYDVNDEEIEYLDTVNLVEERAKRAPVVSIDESSDSEPEQSTGDGAGEGPGTSVGHGGLPRTRATVGEQARGAEPMEAAHPQSSSYFVTEPSSPPRDSASTSTGMPNSRLDNRFDSPRSSAQISAPATGHIGGMSRISDDHSYDHNSDGTSNVNETCEPVILSTPRLYNPVDGLYSSWGTQPGWTTITSGVYHCGNIPCHSRCPTNNGSSSDASSSGVAQSRISSQNMTATPRQGGSNTAVHPGCGTSGSVDDVIFIDDDDDDDDDNDGAMAGSSGGGTDMFADGLLDGRNSGVVVPYAGQDTYDIADRLLSGGSPEFVTISDSDEDESSGAGATGDALRAPYADVGEAYDDLMSIISGIRREETVPSPEYENPLTRFKSSSTAEFDCLGYDVSQVLGFMVDSVVEDRGYPFSDMSEANDMNAPSDSCASSGVGESKRSRKRKSAAPSKASPSNVEAVEIVLSDSEEECLVLAIPKPLANTASPDVEVVELDSNSSNDDANDFGNAVRRRRKRIKLARERKKRRDSRPHRDESPYSGVEGGSADIGKRDAGPKVRRSKDIGSLSEASQLGFDSGVNEDFFHCRAVSVSSSDSDSGAQGDSNSVMPRWYATCAASDTAPAWPRCDIMSTTVPIRLRGSQVALLQLEIRALLRHLVDRTVLACDSGIPLGEQLPDVSEIPIESPSSCAASVEGPSRDVSGENDVLDLVSAGISDEAPDNHNVDSHNNENAVIDYTVSASEQQTPASEIVDGYINLILLDGDVDIKRLLFDLIEAIASVQQQVSNTKTGNQDVCQGETLGNWQTGGIERADTKPELGSLMCSTSGPNDCELEVLCHSIVGPIPLTFPSESGVVGVETFDESLYRLYENQRDSTNSVVADHGPERNDGHSTRFGGIIDSGVSATGYGSGEAAYWSDGHGPDVDDDDDDVVLCYDGPGASNGINIGRSWDRGHRLPNAMSDNESGQMDPCGTFVNRRSNEEDMLENGGFALNEPIAPYLADL